MSNEIRTKYKAELQMWITNSLLIPHPLEQLEPLLQVLIPLMAVAQSNQNKVHPMMDSKVWN